VSQDGEENIMNMQHLFILATGFIFAAGCAPYRPTWTNCGAVGRIAYIQMAEIYDVPKTRKEALEAIQIPIPDESIAAMPGELLAKAWTGILWFRQWNEKGEWDDKGCKETKVTGIQVMKDKISDQWVENWKVEQCGKNLIYRLQVIEEMASSFDALPSVVRVSPPNGQKEKE
jgi:hypothetical protein